ncbi:hypothetical protein PROFUN_04473 [Planoprotostelium fungivorum]|uniref:PA14 domain-containing protein n=1 Tax=Planoprotostelium fungivorum TaxID=1890364 RepID=A0A2P6NVQ1_9EUKA|nr:hypothetical protein PROFUN_04473 [Planoprotostelium fungivorum]
MSFTNGKVNASFPLSHYNPPGTELFLGSVLPQRGGCNQTPGGWKLWSENRLKSFSLGQKHLTISCTMHIVTILLLFVATASAITYPRESLRIDHDSYLSPATLTLQATIRDFWSCNSAHNDTPCGSQSQDVTSCPPDVCHPDFERYTVDDRGIPQMYLDSEGKPMLNTTTDHPSITNSEYYAMFFRNIPGKNMAFVKNITLNYCPECGSTGFYKYENTSFFALNNQGWGNYYDRKNYHFTAEIETSFVYTGGEVFHFLGDDDLWVFIDDKLVLDLGGPHLAETGSIIIDELGLTKYTSHKMKIFYCERYTFLSELTIVTTIQFLCDVVDRCGVCHGDGQSCCSCDDHDPCTYQKCDPNSKEQVCIYEPTCVNPDACTVNTCNNGQCTLSPKSCDDQNACTLDQCTNSTGCIHTTINCDDGNPCTTDTCDAKGGCTHTALVCNDGNACTIDSCSPTSGCTFTAATCDDGDTCTTDTCDKVQGCIHTSTICDDGNECTVDKCSPTQGCTFTSKNCDDSNPCTVDSCDRVKGCTHNVTFCDDNNDCTSDSCGAQGCSHTPISCDDGDACTADTCDAKGGCRSTPIACDDNNLCTTDTCNSTRGCIYTPIKCEGALTCDMATGRCTNPYPPCAKNTCCDDANPCTIDTCDAVNGCRHLPAPAGASCNDGQICNGKDTCDSVGRCSVHTGVPDCGPTDLLCIQVCLNLDAFISL